jgi:hypothetical protein
VAQVTWRGVLRDQRQALIGTCARQHRPFTGWRVVTEPTVMSRRAHARDLLGPRMCGWVVTSTTCARHSGG